MKRNEEWTASSRPRAQRSTASASVGSTTSLPISAPSSNTSAASERGNPIRQGTGEAGTRPASLERPSRPVGLELVLELLARAEADGVASLDLDRLAGLRIAARARRTLLHDPAAEADDRDLAVLLE